MNITEPTNIDCPYCGQTINILIDCSVSEQDYIEDCQVCCRPISMDIHIDNDGYPSVTVKHEDE